MHEIIAKQIVLYGTDKCNNLYKYFTIYNVPYLIFIYVLYLYINDTRTCTKLLLKFYCTYNYAKILTYK